MMNDDGSYLHSTTMAFLRLSALQVLVDWVLITGVMLDVICGSDSDVMAGERNSSDFYWMNWVF